jgi:hypothetical protein
MNTEPYNQTLEGTRLFKHQLRPQRNLWALEQIKEAFTRNGQYRVDLEIHEFVTKDFVEELEARYSHYSMDEIEEILKLGAKGELGDTVAISSRTICGWLRIYKKDYRPKLAAFCKSESIELPQAEEPKRLTPEELQKYIDERRQDFYDNGTLFATTYDILEKYEKIKVTDDEIMRYVRQARTQVKSDMEQQAHVGAIPVAEVIKAKDNPALLDERVANEAKKIAVGALFSKMKLREKP